ncbi:hypothetical protein RB601_003161 [Gaeumannomyces tritici]
MIIYKDIISDDELISDSFDTKLVDDIVYEADCAMITLNAVQVDTGANASAEEADEALDDGPTKTVKEKLKEQGKSDDEIKAFETGAQKWVKEKLLPGFKDFEFYTGEGMNPDAMVALLNYREDGVTPYFTFWKHGLSEMKV